MLDLAVRLKDGHAQCTGNNTRNRYSTWNRKKTTLFSRYYLRNRSTSDIRRCFGLYRCTLRQGTFYRSLAHPPGTPCICTVESKNNQYTFFAKPNDETYSIFILFCLVRYAGIYCSSHKLQVTHTLKILMQQTHMSLVLDIGRSVYHFLQYIYSPTRYTTWLH